MKRKIQKIIETCYDCEFCQKFNHSKVDYKSVFVCVYEPDNEAPNAVPFLLDYNQSKGSNAIPIPDNCPLEDYAPYKNPNHENKTIPNP